MGYELQKKSLYDMEGYEGRPMHRERRSGELRIDDCDDKRRVSSEVIPCALILDYENE